MSRWSNVTPIPANARPSWSYAAPSHVVELPAAAVPEQELAHPSRYAEAEQSLAKALAIEPSHYAASVNLATLFARTKDPRREAQAAKVASLLEQREARAQEFLRIIQVVPYGAMSSAAAGWHAVCSFPRMALKPASAPRGARRAHPYEKRRKTHKMHECGTHDERVPPALAKYWDRTHADEITLEVGTALEGAGPFLIAGATAIGPTQRSA